MKKLGLIIFLLIISVTINFAQLKIGYVDSDTIMNEYSDATDAQKKLDALVAEWQGEIAKIEQDWKKKFDDYEKRKLIMSDQVRAQTEKELIELEKQISDLKQKKFGVNGELFSKQSEIMKPIQNKIFNIIQEVAKEEDLDFVFDRSGDILFLYAKDEYDITQKVLEKLKL